MASIFKTFKRKPIPEGAEIITRKGRKCARFLNGKGRLMTIPLTEDGRQLLIESKKWAIKYKDADGVYRRRAGYTDRAATEQLKAQIERQVERRDAGIFDSSDQRLAEHARKPIADHLGDYHTHLESNVSAWHLSETMRRIKAVLGGCNAKFLSDIDATTVERWLNRLAQRGSGSRTRNTYLSSLKAFLNWCVDVGRLAPR